MILFTDTHFGIKNNSITWFNSQKKFIEEEFIPYIKSINEPVNLIHLGDVFDIRSTVSVYIGEQVRNLFIQLSEIVRSFTIIGGNHDFYSPNSDRYNSINMVLRDIPSINIYTNSSNIHMSDGFMFVPWYEWIKLCDGNINIDQDINVNKTINIFTHADIYHTEPQVFVNKNINIFSGHIHTPMCDKDRRLFNLGSCYPLTFADANQQRGFYDVIFNDNNDIESFKFIPNTTSIKFRRLYNDEIFTKLDDMSVNDYIEVYINKSNLRTKKFSDLVGELSIKFNNFWCIPESDDIEEEQQGNILTKLNMKELIASYIPPELQEKFDQVVKIVEENDKFL